MASLDFDQIRAELEKARTQNEEAQPSQAPAPQAAPEPQQTQPAQEPESMGIVDQVAEVPEAIVSGGARAINEISDTAGSLGGWLEENVGSLGYVNLDFDPSTPLWESTAARTERMRAQGKDPFENELRVDEGLGIFDGEVQGDVGRVVQGMSQFLTGMYLGGRALKAVKATTGIAVVDAAASGAVADAFAFDPHEERLSNLVQQFPSLQNPVSEYLAADADDSEAEGRFKNALEGLGLGVAVDMVLKGIRSFKYLKNGNAEAAIKEADEARAVLPEGAAKFPIKDAAEVAPKAADEAAPEVADAAAPREAPTLEPKAGSADEVDAIQSAERLLGNRAEPVKSKFISEEDTAKLVTQLKHRSAQGMKDIDLDTTGIDFNFSRIKDEEDILTVTNEISRIHQAAMVKAKGGVKDLKSTERRAKRLADDLGENPELYLQRMQARHQDLSNLDAQVHAQRTVVSTMNRELGRMADAVIEGREYNGKFGTQLEADLIAQARMAAEVQALYKGQQTNIARALSAMRASAGASDDLLKGVDPNAIVQGGQKGARKLAKQLQAAKGNAKATRKIVEGSVARKAWDIHNEYWINAILSSPKTHAVNIISGAIQSGFMPAERILGGTLTANPKLVQEGFLQYVGLAKSLKDSTRLALKVLSSEHGQNILDTVGTVRDDAANIAITSRNFGLKKGSFSGNTVDGLGQVIRLSSRFLATEDEFFKQMTFRARVYAKAKTDALTAGKTAKEALAYAEDMVEKAAADNADDLAQMYRKVGLDEARLATFTTPLDGGGFGASLQAMKARHPWFATIMPFVRTPTNIMYYTYQRFPVINLTSKRLREDLMAGGERTASAVAKISVGGGITGIAVMAALDGTITGSGPASWEEKKAKLATGWRPYSIRIPQEDGSFKYISYQRIDPFGMFFGLAADAAEVSGHTDEKTFGELAGALAISLVNNLASKSYLQGLIDTVEVLADPDRNFENFVEKRAGSYVPAGVATFKDDPALREVRSMLDAIKNRIPGLSETLDPKRNVLGEEVVTPTGWGPDWLSPFATGTETGEQPLKALADLEHGFRNPPTSVGNIDLLDEKYRVAPNQTAYDRYQELTGTISLNGRTLRERLTDLVTSERYQERMTDSIVGPDFEYSGTRLKTVQAIIGRYRKAALNALQREIPELQEDIREDRRQLRTYQRGEGLFDPAE